MEIVSRASKVSEPESAVLAVSKGSVGSEVLVVMIARRLCGPEGGTFERAVRSGLADSHVGGVSLGRWIVVFLLCSY